MYCYKNMCACVCERETEKECNRSALYHQFKEEKRQPPPPLKTPLKLTTFPTKIQNYIIKKHDNCIATKSDQFPRSMINIPTVWFWSRMKLHWAFKVTTLKLCMKWCINFLCKFLKHILDWSEGQWALWH